MIGRWLREHLVLILGILVLIYTFVPIFIVILMSFNEPDSRLVYRFDGFTLHNWANPCEDPSMCEALSRSVQIGLLSTLGATILGLCDGERTVAEIVAELHRRYDRVVDDEVRRFLARLVAKRWVGVSHG